ncbi:PREDICTED: protein YLS9-like [Camelina sativa]|uniref:Protein YLS9-like n=1 Tax=Camelina sativa TaxID=90675 RepID=A0ABM0WFH3_CAMSA|nr:PREDICTED: protein YLS9-like [Camelina sativa]
MGDQQKIHPVLQMEANKTTKTTAPAAPRKTELLPIQRPITPPAAAMRSKKGNLCCKIFCWVLSLLVIALIALAIAVAVVYFVFHPKLPRYGVNSLRVTSLGINLDLSLSAEFRVQITARNPNKRIGIYYEKGGHIGVWYDKTKLCEGPIPRFYQGHRNVTKLNVVLTGRAQAGNTVLSALQQQQQTGRVPLDLKVDAPVAVKLGKLKMKKIRILGNCKLVVDSLSTNNNINIKASDCSFKVKL